MRITLAQLKKIIREEVQRTTEAYTSRHPWRPDRAGRTPDPWGRDAPTSRAKPYEDSDLGGEEDVNAPDECPKCQGSGVHRPIPGNPLGMRCTCPAGRKRRRPVGDYEPH